MSVFLLESGNTMKYSLSQRGIPRASPSGFPLGSGYISSYIAPLVKIHVQYVDYLYHALSGSHVINANGTNHPKEDMHR